jgi:hypothetical protein
MKSKPFLNSQSGPKNKLMDALFATNIPSMRTFFFLFLDEIKRWLIYVKICHAISSTKIFEK